MIKFKVITTILISPRQRRTWKLRLAQDLVLFQKMLPYGKVEHDSLRAQFGNWTQLVQIWSNPDIDTRYGWGFRPSVDSGGWAPRSLIDGYLWVWGDSLVYFKDFYYASSIWEQFSDSIIWQRPKVPVYTFAKKESAVLAPR